MLRSKRALLVLALTAVPAAAQICRLSVAGLNRNRRVSGEISAECPDPLHTAPFGNWGVTSNFGLRRNGRQFEGWCNNTRICDNAGNCRTECRDGWYEWNSCTTHVLFRPPNCTLYNDRDCTTQISVTGVNVLGTQSVDIPVTCPALAPAGDRYERGGCLDVRSYARTDNFMSVYELDPITGDELIQTLYFPSLLVTPSCTVWDCQAAGSDWVAPIAYDSPAAPPKIFAEMAMVINSATFLDPTNRCAAPPLPLRVVSSASGRGPAVSPDSLATVFTGEVAARSESATSQPLPTSLAGVEVQVTQSGNFRASARLLYVSPRQINFVVPAGLQEGPATVSIAAGNTVRATGLIDIQGIEPGIFTADGPDGGIAAAIGVRIGPDGAQVVQYTAQCTQAGACTPLPLDLGSTSDTFVLVLFGTGWRGVSSSAGVRAVVAGVPAQVLYAGAQPTFAGLDQMNLLLPKSLAGSGLVEVRLVVDGKQANPVRVWIR